tara:strand:- start:1431 stop:3275 length:1845 start_codon:yes stop_codon:yes gene_type:complete
MTGALLQLVAIGSEDLFITGNPQMTFFKSVYKRYSNFASQSIDVYFNGTETRLNYKSPTTLYATIPKYGHLLSKLHLELTLPTVFKSVPFRWIDNIGTSMINHVKLYIGDQLIEKIEGKYIECYYNTILSNEQLRIYNDMIGNVPELTKPYRDIEDIRMIYESKISTNSNITGYVNTIPTTIERRIIIPIPLWFSKYDGLEIPLVSLDETKIKIEIELKSIEQLYVIGENTSITVKGSTYISGGIGGSAAITGITDHSDEKKSNRFGEELYKNNTIYHTVYKRPDLSNPEHKLQEWFLKPTMNIEYIFLSSEEEQLMKNYEHRYLIERVQINEFLGNTNERILQLELFNPVKELYIVPQRDDIHLTNQYSNYTNYDDHRMSDTVYKGQSYLYELANQMYNDDIANAMANVAEKKDANDGFVSARDELITLQNTPPINYLGKFRTDKSRSKEVFLKDLDRRIKPNDALTTSQIYEFAKDWEYRDTADIPSIHLNNYDYFTENIIESMEIRLNGDVRLAQKNYDYYHTIQPYIHHTNSLPKGVLMYSFSYNPEKYQPSGWCNLTNFKKTELYIKFKNPIIYEVSSKKNLKYDTTVYATTYNILKIEKGECKLLFST